MASDITLAVGDGSRRMTYAALAEARGISMLAARQLTRRHRWHKQVGNDGLVVVSVPLSALENSQKSAKSADTASRQSVGAADTASEAASDAASDTASDAIRAFEVAVGALHEQLGIANARTERAELLAAEAQASERHALELVKHVAAEASEQRKRADDARAESQAAIQRTDSLQAKLDQLQARGLWARIRNRR